MYKQLTDEELDHMGRSDFPNCVCCRRAVAEIRKTRAALKKIKRQGCDGPAAYDALDCKAGKIMKKDWCGCCIANAALY